MKKLIGCVLCAILLFSVKSYSQGFGGRGCIELGGNAFFQSSEAVNNGGAGPNQTSIGIAPLFGYFIFKGVELGFNPIQYTLMDYQNTRQSNLMMLFSPAFNFTTNGIIFPFIEGQVGYKYYHIKSSDSDINGFCWGGRLGIKMKLTKGLSANISILYQEVKTNYSFDKDIERQNTLNIGLGLSYFLGGK